jgi:hypothetical protein
MTEDVSNLLLTRLEGFLGFNNDSFKDSWSLKLNEGTSQTNRDVEAVIDAYHSRVSIPCHVSLNQV